MRILVVEDDPRAGPAIKAVLGSAGHEVVGPCRDAAKALRRVARARPDLALVDFNLAGGEDGLSLSRKLRDRPLEATSSNLPQHRRDALGIVHVGRRGIDGPRNAGLSPRRDGA